MRFLSPPPQLRLRSVGCGSPTSAAPTVCRRGGHRLPDIWTPTKSCWFTTAASSRMRAWWPTSAASASRPWDRAPCTAWWWPRSEWDTSPDRRCPRDAQVRNASSRFRNNTRVESSCSLNKVLTPREIYQHEGCTSESHLTAMRTARLFLVTLN